MRLLLGEVVIPGRAKSSLRRHKLVSMAIGGGNEGEALELLRREAKLTYRV